MCCHLWCNNVHSLVLDIDQIGLKRAVPKCDFYGNVGSKVGLGTELCTFKVTKQITLFFPSTYSLEITVCQTGYVNMSEIFV